MRKSLSEGGSHALLVLLAVGTMAGAASPAFADDLIRPKVLVIATYETGKDRGDIPGELQFWAEREKLDQEIRVPGIDHPILTNGKGLYAMVSGTTSRCTVQIMALAMDPRFDLSHTYFLVSGIAGADPAQITVGSAVWIRHVVDGDPAFELDHQDTPASWPYGIIALGATEPGKVPANVDSAPAAGVSDNGSGGVGKVAYTLNASLVDWAYGLTRDLVLPDNQALAASRAPYLRYPNALQRPLVVEGDSMGADHFWSGPIMTEWAEDWVRLYTRGAGALAIADCEDQGILLAIHQLGRLGRVDPNRLLILRTASNFTVRPPGVAAEKFLFDDLASSPGYLPALEANYQVGSVVVAKLLEGWDRFRDQTPRSSVDNVNMYGEAP
jgi:purine nucleoside permease